MCHIDCQVTVMTGLNSSSQDHIPNIDGCQATAIMTPYHAESSEFEYFLITTIYMSW